MLRRREEVPSLKLFGEAYYLLSGSCGDWLRGLYTLTFSQNTNNRLVCLVTDQSYCCKGGLLGRHLDDSRHRNEVRSQDYLHGLEQIKPVRAQVKMPPCNVLPILELH